MNYIEVIAVLIAFMVLFGAVLELLSMTSSRAARSPFVVGPKIDDRCFRTARLAPKGATRC